MRLPTQKKILREDLKDAPPWVNALIEPINSFMESTYQALNKNITFSENISSFIKELVYTTPSTYPLSVPDVSFLNQLRVKPIGVQVIQAYERTSYVAAPGPVYIPWIEDNGSIIVSSITGLAASKSYLIRIVVF